MAKSDKRRGKPNRARPKGKKKRARKLTLPERVSVLEAHVAGLKHFTGFAPDTTETQPLQFTLQPGGPPVVKLVFSDETLVLGTGPVASKPIANGSVISLIIQLEGNPNQQAVVNVTNAIPEMFSATIPGDRSNWSEPRQLIAKW